MHAGSENPEEPHIQDNSTGEASPCQQTPIYPCLCVEDGVNPGEATHDANELLHTVLAHPKLAADYVIGSTNVVALS